MQFERQAFAPASQSWKRAHSSQLVPSVQLRQLVAHAEQALPLAKVAAGQLSTHWPPWSSFGETQAVQVVGPEQAEQPAGQEAQNGPPASLPA
jgi:hypothetical protein